MKLFRHFEIHILPLIASLALAGPASAVPIEDILKKIDPLTGKASDTTTSFGITGVVSARAALPDGRVVAFVHPPNAQGVAVVASAADGARLIPRNEVELAGKLGDGPFGVAAVLAAPGSINVNATNKSAGTAEARGAEFFKDASALAGRYVSVTNVMFATATFDETGKATVKSDAGEVPLIVTTGLKGKAPPAGAYNVFGVPVKVDGRWALVAARFISVNNKAAQAVAQKRTCFTCHNPDMKVVGPAYRDVAAKYKDDDGAIEKMIVQMEKGGTGKWGPVPMPPLGAVVPADERKQLAEWIWGYRWDAFLAN
jgi:cytochrome c